MYDLPKVSFILPVLNEERSLPVCLESIRQQDYPQNKVEIVVADGGSTDNTRKICNQYDCVVLDNPRVRAEYGHELAFKRAQGEILFIFAADNSLPQKSWIRLMVKPFIDDETIFGTYTHIEPAIWDNSFNRYYSLLHVEPFTWFVFGNTVQPKLFHKEYKIKEKKDGYIVYDFPLKKYPLIAWAQGFGLRRNFKRKAETFGDDILPFIQMVEDGCKVAYVPGAGIHHHHLTGFKSYLKKYQWRVRNSLYQKDIGFDNRAKYLSFLRKVRKYLWLIYGCTFIGPIIDSLRWYIKDREKCWFWHIPASVGLSYLIIYELTRQKFCNLLNLFNKGKGGRFDKCKKDIHEYAYRIR